MEPTSSDSPKTPEISRASAPKDRKAGREWVAIVISFLALAVSVFGAWDAHVTTRRAEEQFVAQRSLLLVADLDNQKAPKGLVFNIHAQSSDEHLDKLEIYLPKQLDPQNEAASAILYNEDLHFSFERFDEAVQATYCKELTEFQPPDVYVISRSFTYIPIGIEAEYSISGQTMHKRALYHFNIDMRPSESKSKTSCSLKYTYLVLDRDLKEGELAKNAANDDVTAF